MPLDWPDETVVPRAEAWKWTAPGSNLVLDFHGDPLKADLVVFSDGNHHMALLPALQAFCSAYPQVADIFYATTPPMPVLTLLRTGALRLGNLIFDFIPLGGTKTRPAPSEQNRTAAVHMGVVGNGGLWGAKLAKFLKSREVANIYNEHGLRHVLDL